MRLKRNQINRLKPKLVHILLDSLAILTIQIDNPNLTMSLGYLIQNLNGRRLKDTKILVIRITFRKSRNQRWQKVIVLAGN